MSEAVTFTLPEIPAESFAILETLKTEQADSAAAALQAIRAKYAPLAKHAGFIRIAHWSAGRESKDYHYEEGGKKVHGLLVYDGFSDERDVEFAGRYTGFRVYLTEKGEWFLVARDGSWSQYQNSPDYWTCDQDVISDEEFASRCKLTAVLAQFRESLKTLAEKIPQRMTRLRQQSALAAQVIEALAKEGK